MSDIKERLRALGDASDNISIYHICDKAAYHIEQQEAEIARLRKDAERYKLMRSVDWQNLRVMWLFSGPDFDQLGGEELDAALDLYRSKASTQEAG